MAELGVPQVVDRDVQRDGAAAVEGRRGVQERQQGHRLHSRRGTIGYLARGAHQAQKLLTQWPLELGTLRLASGDACSGSSRDTAGLALLECSS